MEKDRIMGKGIMIIGFIMVIKRYKGVKVKVIVMMVIIGVLKVI